MKAETKVKNHWFANETLDVTPKIHLTGYSFRTVVPYDDVLFDPHLANWVEEDGSLIICDVGGQPRRGWDPLDGHGALWRLTAEDRLEPVIPWGRVYRGALFYPRLIPSSFGRWGGQSLVAAQLLPGRDGAHYDHILHKWDRRSDVLVPFAIFPRSDSAVGKGLPTAPAIGDFGPPGSTHEGTFCIAMMRNNTIYKVTPDGKAEVLAICDGVHNKMLLPRISCFGNPNNFPGSEGELIIGGVPDWHFTASGHDGAKQIVAGDLEYYRIGKNGKLDDTPLKVGDRMLARPIEAPSGFGPLSGRLLYSAQGKTMQSQVHSARGPLPHDATIRYRNSDNEIVPFVSNLRGGFNDFMFRGNKLIITHFGKSWSTGEYHEPDGMIWEVCFDGK